MFISGSLCPSKGGTKRSNKNCKCSMNALKPLHFKILLRSEVRLARTSLPPGYFIFKIWPETPMINLVPYC